MFFINPDDYSSDRSYYSELDAWAGKMTEMVNLPLHVLWILLDFILVTMLVRGIIRHRERLAPATMIIPAVVATIFHFVPWKTALMSDYYGVMVAAFTLMPILTLFLSLYHDYHNETILILLISPMPFIAIFFTPKWDYRSPDVPTGEEAYIALVVIAIVLVIFLICTLLNLIRRVCQGISNTVALNISILIGVGYAVVCWLMLLDGYAGLKTYTTSG